MYVSQQCYTHDAGMDSVSLSPTQLSRVRRNNNNNHRTQKQEMLVCGYNYNKVPSVSVTTLHK